MDVEMKMPDLATTGSPIRILRWLVDVGQSIQRGQPLLEVETDKAVMQVESVVTGRLESASVHEGDEVAAGQIIATFEADRAAAAIAPRETTTLAAPTRPQELASAGRGPADPSRRRSFFARNRERRMDVLANMQRTGRTRTIALSVPQRVAARRMERSKQTIPHFYLQTSANAEEMVARRLGVAGKVLVWDAFFVHAAGMALRRFERMSYRWEEDHLVSQDVDAVGLAVDLEGDLFTLAIEQPADKHVEQISDEIMEGVARLRAGDPQARMSRRANLTVSNLGGSNVESFIAVINPPESAILAIGKVMPVATVVEGQLAVRHRVNLTLSVDHRVVSGKYAGEFLGAIVRELESL
jgi:pyruvate dehydrogenase E2 component (dihydrolipoamide acetyltransferase)